MSDVRCDVKSSQSQNVCQLLVAVATVAIDCQQTMGYGANDFGAAHQNNRYTSAPTCKQTYRK